jgi:hypothetical protein
MGALADDYAVTASDIQNKQLKFNFAPLSASFSQIHDLYSIIDEKETRKLYGYLHLLKSFTSADMKRAVTIAAYLLSQRSEPFLFAFYQMLSGSSLTKAERVALAYGTRLMYKTYTSFITSDAAQDVSLMFGLLYHVATVCAAEFSGLVTITECAEVKAAPVRYDLSDDPSKETYIISSLKYCHLTLPLVVVNRSAHSFVDYLTSTGVRPPLLFDLLNRYLKEASFLPILHPRDITNSTQNRLTYHPSGQLWINIGLKDSCHDIELDRRAMLQDVLRQQPDFYFKKRLDHASGEVFTQRRHWSGHH